jgi:protein subunit release factor A
MRDSVIIEIRAAEGGADAKDLVIEQTKIYIRLAGRRSL